MSLGFSDFLRITRLRIVFSGLHVRLGGVEEEYLQPIKSSRGGRSVEHKGFYLNQMQRRIRREFIRNAKTQSEYNAMKKRSDDLGEKSSPTRGGVQFNSSWHFFLKINEALLKSSCAF